MKTVTEILGGAQGLLNISFDPQSCFEETLNDRQKTFLQIPRRIEWNSPSLYRPYAGTGRKPHQYLPFPRGQWAKNYFQIAATTMPDERLKADSNLRLLRGFSRIPGQASFSRTYSCLAAADIQPEMRESFAKETFKDKAVYHASRNSTAINARKTVKKENGKNGPPKWQHKQNLTPIYSLKKLDTAYSFGRKKNS